MDINFWSSLLKPIVGLSPMDGITDFPMREIQVKIAKPSVIYTEFVSAEGLIRKEKVFLPKLKFSSQEKPIVAQIFGFSEESFFNAVKIIAKLNFDGIDINMGCPAKNILEQGGGAALIGKNNQVQKIILSVFKALKSIDKVIPISIKTRIADTEEETEKWLKFLSLLPISAICVHARTRKQSHSGETDFKKLLKYSHYFRQKKIVFLGNGGIKNRKMAIDYSLKYNLDGALIGQAAIGNPWVFKDKYPIEKKELFEIMTQHTITTENFYGPNRFVNVKKHLAAYCKNFPGCKKLRGQLMMAESLLETLDVLRTEKEQIEK